MTSLDALEELLHVNRCTPGRISAEIAKIFRVRQTEVGLLWLEGDFLRFLFPIELQSAGAIPITGSAVAARTASTRQPAIFNRFPQVPHHSIFEQIKLKDTERLADMPDPIQKMMSAPIMEDNGTVLGVVQVCRKGMTPGIAGPDFTDEDLDLLVRSARRIAMLMPELDYGDNHQPPQMLRFQHSTDAPKRANAS